MTVNEQCAATYFCWPKVVYAQLVGDIYSVYIQDEMKSDQSTRRDKNTHTSRCMSHDSNFTDSPHTQGLVVQIGRKKTLAA